MSRLLVVVMAPLDEGDLRRAAGVEEPDEVHVVAPAAHQSFLQWLAADEDEARERAGQAAAQAAASLEELGPVGAESGDPDPLQAVDDALRKFPADEIVAVVPPPPSAEWLERASIPELERFGLPVRFVFPPAH